MPALDNAKRERFCREYVIDGNGAQAAIRAGYKAPASRVTASRMLTDANVQRRIAELRGALNDKLEITAERVLKEAARLAFSDVRKVFNPDGNIKPITELDDDAAAAISGFESVRRPIPGKDGEMELVTKFRLWDKAASIGMLGKHLKLFDNPANEAIEGLAAALDRARLRRPPRQ